MEITELPEELYQVLFEFLNLHDLLELRLVCRFFNQQVNAYRVYDLVIRPTATELRLHDSKNWFYKPTPGYSFRNFLLPSKAFVLKRPLFEIERLRRLKFEVHHFEQLKIDHREIVNRLVHLVHLEIFYSFIYNTDHENWFRLSKQNGKLILPKLKRLFILSNCVNHLDLEIDAPNLHDFCLICREVGRIAQRENFLKILFVHPSSVKCLGISEYELLTRTLSALKSIEHLSVERGSKVDGQLLADYPNLVSVTTMTSVPLIHIGELHISLNSYELTSLNELSALEKEPNCPVCRMNLQKAPVSPPDKLIPNFQRLPEDVHFPVNTKYIRYEELMKADVFKQLSNVYCYSQADIQVDTAHLIKFLAKCQDLKELYLDRCQVNQKFLNELPRIASLRELAILEKNQKPDFDFRFLNRMYNLEVFNTYQSLVKHEGLSLNRHRYLSRVSFNVHFNKFPASFLVRKSKNENEFRLNIGVRKQYRVNCALLSKVGVPIKEVSYVELIKQANLLEHIVENKTQKQKKTKRFLTITFFICLIILALIFFSIEFCKLPASVASQVD